MSMTRMVRHIDAPRAAVHAALADARTVQTCMGPDGTTSQEDNETGWSRSLGKLAKLLESRV